MYGQKKIVIMSIVLFVVSNILVYLLFLNTKYKDIEDEAGAYFSKLFKDQCVDEVSEKINNKMTSVIDEISKEEEKIAQNKPVDTEPNPPKDDVVTGDIQEIATGENDASTGLLDNNLVEVYTGTASEDLPQDKVKPKIRMLSGTKQYFENIQILTDLGLDYKYILIDDLDIYYIYLGTGDLGLEQKVNSLGGSIYEIKDPQEILKNILFGKKVSYINLPEYKGKLVNVVFELDSGEQWLVQIYYDIYNDNKKYIKDLFSK